MGLAPSAAPPPPPTAAWQKSQGVRVKRDGKGLWLEGRVLQLQRRDGGDPPKGSWGPDPHLGALDVIDCNSLENYRTSRLSEGMGISAMISGWRLVASCLRNAWWRAVVSVLKSSASQYGVHRKLPIAAPPPPKLTNLVLWGSIFLENQGERLPNMNVVSPLFLRKRHTKSI